MEIINTKEMNFNRRMSKVERKKERKKERNKERKKNMNCKN